MSSASPNGLFEAARSTAAGQVAYLEAIHDQLGSRLAFWVNLLFNDFTVQTANDAGMTAFAHIGLRESDGSAKPALEVWDSFRA